MKKINVIRSHAKGDVFLAEPILSQLAIKHKVNLKTLHPHLFGDHYPFSINKEDEYDHQIILDLTYEKNPEKHILEAYIDEVKKEINDEIIFRPPQIIFTDAEKKLISNLRKDQYILVNIDAKPNYLDTRKVHGLNLAELANYVQKTYKVKMLEVGLYNDHGLPKVNIENEREAMVLIAGAKLFIGLDSLFLHIAGSLKVNSIGIFGSVNPKLRLFDGYPIKILQQPCELQHCYHNGFHFGERPCELGLDIPKCAIQSNENVIDKIDEFFKNDIL